jgi:tetrapyrrole methylase family protein/MazG family protein
MKREGISHDSFQEIEVLFAKLYGIIKKLREPDGCAWDREQTPLTMRTHLIEEAYEAVNAIDENDDSNLREEIGDLFLILAMIARMKEETGKFTLQDVLSDICEKLIRRHPHVFGTVKMNDVTEILEQWERIKEDVEGKKAKGSILNNAPRTLPPLESALFIQKKVSKVGFDWDSLEPAWEKLEEETGELKDALRAGNDSRLEDELGDLIFTVVNLGRLLKIDPSLALNKTNQKFVRRFKTMEKRVEEKGLGLAEMRLDQMDEIWDQIKDEEDESRSK